MSKDAYTKALEKFAKMMVADVLEHEGVELDEDECCLASVVEYLEISNSFGEHYSIYDWIEDTRMNYPECFKLFK